MVGLRHFSVLQCQIVYLKNRQVLRKKSSFCAAIQIRLTILSHKIFINTISMEDHC